MKNKYPEIEFEPLKAAIEEKAHLLLAEITEDNVKTFAQEVKLIAEGVMEQYIFKVYNLYSEGARKISDHDVLEAFIDYSSGYQSKMLTWKESHPIQLKEIKIEIPNLPENPKINNQLPVITVSAGTVIAIGLFIFSNAWVALAAEILTLAIAYKQQTRQQKARQAYEADLLAYNNQLGMKRMTLINGLTEDLVKWLEMGKEYSDTVLTSYNL
jgi:hypothetical protein